MRSTTGDLPVADGVLRDFIVQCRLFGTHEMRSLPDSGLN